METNENLVQRQKERNKSNATIIEASRIGKVEIIEHCLITEGSDVNETNSFGETALIVALKNDNKEIVKVLIENGAQLNNVIGTDFTTYENPVFGKVIGKCRFCENIVWFFHYYFQLYYCETHKYLIDSKYIMYYIDSEGELKPIRSKIEFNKYCPFLTLNGKCNYGESCRFYHNNVEEKLFKFIDESKKNNDKFSIQAVALQFQCTSKTLEYEKKVFDRCFSLHEISETGDLKKLEQFVKFSESDIFFELNKNGETILQVATSKKDYVMIKYLLNLKNLVNCLNSEDFSYSDYFSFINHASHNGTAFTSFLESIDTDNQQKWQSVLDLFLECDFCELDEALVICKRKNLVSYTEKVEELIECKSIMM